MAMMKVMKEGSHMRQAVLLFFGLLALSSCTVTIGSEDQKVNIDCAAEGNDIKCDVKHTQGDARVNACWEIHFECQNGAKPSGSSCQEVGPGETKERRIPI